ncbi:MAG TPA: hypothetical protein VNU92_15645 [Edaphobacter sp.]|jgi:hypothetical protein|nr:hypothetical protein [Edaphobacter sp.]
MASDTKSIDFNATFSTAGLALVFPIDSASIRSEPADGEVLSAAMRRVDFDGNDEDEVEEDGFDDDKEDDEYDDDEDDYDDEDEDEDEDDDEDEDEDDELDDEDEEEDNEEELDLI